MPSRVDPVHEWIQHVAWQKAPGLRCTGMAIESHVYSPTAKCASWMPARFIPNCKEILQPKAQKATQPCKEDPLLGKKSNSCYYSSEQGFFFAVVR